VFDASMLLSFSSVLACLKLFATASVPVIDPSEYRSLAGALHYLTLTCLDLAYVV
jgi:hypothetical protein